MIHKQLYVLLTRFLSPDGVGEIEDFMPVGPAAQAARCQDEIVRRVKVVRGSLTFEVICEPAFDYARTRPRVTIQLNWLCENWHREDEGIWETRGGRRHFVYSKMMCWVALDRGLRLGDWRAFPADRERWIRERDAMYEEIMTRGWRRSCSSTGATRSMRRPCSCRWSSSSRPSIRRC